MPTAFGRRVAELAELLVAGLALPAVDVHVGAERRRLQHRERCGRPRPSPRRAIAAAIARSFPTMSAVLRSSSATSAPRCASVAEPVDRSKPTIATPSGADDDVPGVQRAVRDPGVVELPDLRPEVVEHRVGDARGVDVAEPVPRDRADDEQRRARAGDAGDDDRRHAHAGPLGEQRDVRLVLDLAQPGEVHLRAGVLVEHRPAELGDELRVRLVATEHADPAAARRRPARA